MLVSAERAPLLGSPSQALVLDGPRVERLQSMAESLSGLSGEIILRLDPVDDQLLDVAAQQARVSIRRGAAAPDGLGILAHVTPHKRNLA